MAKQLLQIEQGTLHFTKTGNGARILLAFHGFGQNGHVFNELATALADDYTVYLFDVFFHSDSEWHLDEQPLEKHTWISIIDQFLHAHSISTFSVLGFSMGGKFALATLEGFPDRIQEIFLLAPDGIKTSAWYSLATYPVILRKLFKSMITHPNRFEVIARTAHRLGLIDKGILRFVESQMNTVEKRTRVYYTWVVFRHLTFNMAKLAHLINQYQIRLVMIVGRYDKVITAKNMNALLKKVSVYSLFIPETGHNGVIDASIKILKNKDYLHDKQN